MCVEVSRIRVGDATECAYRSIFCLHDRIWGNAVVFCKMFENMFLKAIVCFDWFEVFADKAPAIVVIRCSS